MHSIFKKLKKTHSYGNGYRYRRGWSTTKIIGVDGEGIKHPMIVKATDPITSLFGAFGKYIYDNNISLSGIEKVMLTGVGSA